MANIVLAPNLATWRHFWRPSWRRDWRDWIFLEHLKLETSQNIREPINRAQWIRVPIIQVVDYEPASMLSHD